MIFRYLHTLPRDSADAHPMRWAVRAFAIAVLFCVWFSAADAAAPDASGDPPGAGDDPDAAAAEVAARRNLEKLTATGMEMWKIGDISSAERAFGTALNLNVPNVWKRPLMLDLADLYADAGKRMKAISILEKFALLFPDDPETPAHLMRLGLLYRDEGAMEQATNKFFQVLNATMRSSEELGSHRQLSMKARLEIAEAFDARGMRNEARKYYSRLQVLHLDPADRERVHLREAQLQFELEKWEAAAAELARFLEAYPASARAMEARYLYAKSLDRLGRTDEAVHEVLVVLRSQDPDDPARAKETAYWQRRTGNELANKLYESGDFVEALAVYQALARASDDPAWRWPAVYQVGLCFERLNHPGRAAEAYELILSAESAPPGDYKLTETLSSVRDMAEWRLRHLDWVEDYGKRLQILMAENNADK